MLRALSGAGGLVARTDQRAADGKQEYPDATCDSKKGRG